VVWAGGGCSGSPVVPVWCSSPRGVTMPAQAARPTAPPCAMEEEVVGKRGAVHRVWWWCVAVVVATSRRSSEVAKPSLPREGAGGQV